MSIHEWLDPKKIQEITEELNEERLSELVNKLTAETDPNLWKSDEVLNNLLATKGKKKQQQVGALIEVVSLLTHIYREMPLEVQRYYAHSINAVFLGIAYALEMTKEEAQKYGEIGKHDAMRCATLAEVARGNGGKLP